MMYEYYRAKNTLFSYMMYYRAMTLIQSINQSILMLELQQ